MDWLPELTDDDLTTLVEALEAWESKDTATEMFGDVVEAVMGDRVPELRAKRVLDKQKAERAKVVRKERSVILRAKLLTLRERQRVERTCGATTQLRET